jgi:hypothetical protein
MSTTPEESSSSHLPNTELVLRQSTGIMIGGIEYSSAQQAYSDLIKLPAADAYTGVKQLCAQMLKQRSGHEDFMIEFQELIRGGLACFPNGDISESLEEDLLPFTAEVNRIKASRIAAEKAFESLFKFLTPANDNNPKLRTLAFVKYIKENHINKGKNFAQDLRKLLGMKKGDGTKITLREAICVLNNAILHRNGQLHYGFARAGITGREIHAAINWVKENHDWADIFFINNSSLSHMGYRFDESGILIKLPFNESYDDSLFPSFNDEPADWPPVMVGEPVIPPDEDSEQPDPQDAADSTIDPRNLEQDVLPADRTSADVPPQLDLPSQQDPPATPTRAPRIPLPSSTGKRLNYDEGPTPRKKNRFTPSKVVAIPNCCKMPEKWLRDFELWEDLAFSEQLEIIEKIALRHHHGEGLYELPCQTHLTRLCMRMDLEVHYDDDRMLEIFHAIFQVVRNRQSFHYAWIHESTRRFFLRSARVMAYRSKAFVPGRFHPDLQAVSTLPKVDREAADPALSFDYDKNGAKDYPDLLKCLEPGALKALKDEIRMLVFHSRKDSFKDGFLINGYYPMIAQVLWACPLVWLHYHRSTPGNPVHFMAYPQPLRYLPANETASRSYFEGDLKLLHDSKSLLAEYLLEGETFNISYSPPPTDRQALVEFTDKFDEIRNYTDFSKSEELTTGLEFYLQNHGSNIRVALPEGGIHYYRNATIVTHDFHASKARVSVPLSFVAVDSLGACENEVTAMDVKKAHDTLTVPTTGRFRDSGSDEAFIPGIRLEGLGEIFDMVRGVKEPTHPGVVAEIKKWASFTGKSHDNHKYTTWGKLVSTQIKLGLENLKSQEEEAFKGNKSFFRMEEKEKKKGKGNVEPDEEPAEEEPLYIVISDDDMEMDDVA